MRGMPGGGLSDAACTAMRRKGTRIEIHTLTPEGLQVCIMLNLAAVLLFLATGRPSCEPPSALATSTHPWQHETGAAVQGVVDVPIYGRIASLRLFRFPVRDPERRRSQAAMDGTLESRCWRGKRRAQRCRCHCPCRCCACCAPC